MSKGKFIVETHCNTLIWSCASFRGVICNIIPQILGIWVAPPVKEACVCMWQSQDPGEQQEARGVSQLLYYAAHDLQGFLHLMSLMSHFISRLYRLLSPAWLRLHTDVDLLILQDQYGGKCWVIIHRFVFSSSYKICLKCDGLRLLLQKPLSASAFLNEWQKRLSWSRKKGKRLKAERIEAKRWMGW